jgi:hypothetical protein
MPPKIFHNGATYEALLKLNGEATHTEFSGENNVHTTQRYAKKLGTLSTTHAA